jgi:outer membrane murein-binding lipoprotein Lpp
MKSVSLNPGDQLPALLERIERREKSARILAIVYSLAPVALTVVLLSYTSSSVRNAQKQIDALKTEATTYTTQIDTLKKNSEGYKSQSQSAQGDAANFKGQVTELQTQLADAQKALSEAVNLSRAVRTLDYANAKEFASRFPGSESLVMDLLDLRQRRIKWKHGGQTVQEGFDSPTFALYMLKQKRAASGIELRPGDSASDVSRSLYDKLQPTTQPHNGDLVFYPAGYAMFYFTDPREGPFVLGMTPFGIAALKSDFAKPVGYRQVQWR